MKPELQIAKSGAIEVNMTSINVVWLLNQISVDVTVEPRSTDTREERMSVNIDKRSTKVKNRKFLKKFTK